MTKDKRKKAIKEIFTGTQVGMLLEDVRDDFNVIAEQHTDMTRKIDNLDEKIDNLDERLNLKIDNLENNLKADLKSISDYLSRIDKDYADLKFEVDKIKIGKTDRKDFNWLKEKVLEIEKRLANCKKQQDTLAAKA